MEKRGNIYNNINYNLNDEMTIRRSENHIKQAWDVFPENESKGN